MKLFQGRSTFSLMRVLTGKGANSTISYVHYFFDRLGLGETEVQLHADNCGAQNKNSAFLWYCLWRVMNGLHKVINYNFLMNKGGKFLKKLWCCVGGSITR